MPLAYGREKRDKVGMRLVMATRRSALALAQSRAFARALEAATPGLEVDELLVVTSGDKTQDRPLSAIGGKGLFIKELEEALVDGRADFAVHSIKDVPAETPEGLEIACVPRREDPRDALVSLGGEGLMGLPRGARVGTGSLRRAACLRTVRPDLEVLPLRGNVDTRLRKLDAGEFDAVVLAFAGLRRLGLEGRVSEVLEPEVCLPAVGQGALGIECRAGDGRVGPLLVSLEDAEAATAVEAERAVLAAVEGSCKIPVGAHASRTPGGGMRLRGMLAEEDGTLPAYAERELPRWPDREEAARLGRGLGEELRAALAARKGADEKRSAT